jgi:squalene-hopene/tetraprenyl-beta-curcumene cyclase
MARNASFSTEGQPADLFSVCLDGEFPMKTLSFATALAALCFVTSVSAQAPSPVAAAGYLDARMSWWMTWPSAARDHGTFCVSCHTAAPYALGRPALRSALGEQAPSPVERKFLDNVTKRVHMWKEVEPFYPDATRGVPKTAESRGTESIFNALILANYGSPDARMAFDNMWAEQLKTGDAKGAWAWLQFHNSPWEGDSQYYGATLAAIAVGTAPGNYRDTPEIQDGLKLLREYLQRECAPQILIDRVMLLWASAKIPGLLTPAQQKAIMDEALAKQQADGGFSLSAFVGGWARHDKTPLETKSDGYATGLVVYALEQTGMPRDQPQLKRGLTWLTQNQDKTEGRWLAYSLNKQRDLASDVGKFMSDAATAYAVLALQGAN